MISQLSRFLAGKQKKREFTRQNLLHCHLIMNENINDQINFSFEIAHVILCLQVPSLI